MTLSANFRAMTPEFFLGSPTTDKRPCKYFYDIKTELVASGWTVEASGDGLALYGASSDVITVRGDGAGGVNTLAWVRLSNPDGREICGQAIDGFTAAFDTAVRIRWKYSFAGGFTGGTPSATQVPSATDEGVFAGSGTDAAPAGVGGYAWQAQRGIDFTSIRGMYLGIFETVSPYRFIVILQKDVASLANKGGIFMDVVDAAGGRDDWDDADPAVLCVAGRSGTTAFSARTGGDDLMDNAFRTTNCPMAHWDGGNTPTSAMFLPCQAQGPGGQQYAINRSAGDNFGGAFVVPALYVRHPYNISPPAGDIAGAKGMSTIWAYHGYSADSGWGSNRIWTRDGVVAAYLQMQNCLMPWDDYDPYLLDGGWINKSSETVNIFSMPESFGGQAAADMLAPVISNLVPTVGSAVEVNDPITFDVTDETSLALVAILVSFADGSVFVAHDGDSFRQPFLGSNNLRTNITDGFRFTLLKDGGWIDGSGDPSAPTFEYLVLDSGGSLGVVT